MSLLVRFYNGVEVGCSTASTRVEEGHEGGADGEKSPLGFCEGNMAGVIWTRPVKDGERSEEERRGRSRGCDEDPPEGYTGAGAGDVHG